MKRMMPATGSRTSRNETERLRITGHDRKPGNAAVLGRFHHVVNGYTRGGVGQPPAS
jgi:hypothetical protein